MKKKKRNLEIKQRKTTQSPNANPFAEPSQKQRCYINKMQAMKMSNRNEGKKKVK